MAEAATIEEKAKGMGHVSQEDWKGDPDKWRPADDFVERGENILKIVQKKNKDLEKKFSELTTDLDITLKANKREVEEAKKTAFDLATKDYETKLSALDKKEVEAFEEGDAEKFTKIKKERSDLKAPVEPVKVAEPENNPIFEDWNKKETWYKSDHQGNDELSTEAEVQASALGKKYPKKPWAEILDMAAKNVKKLHPEKFENGNRNIAGNVEEGGENNISAAGKSFNSLPASAKEAYQRNKKNFEDKGRKFISKEQFVKDWNE
jgi:hypothetical protein